MRHSRHVAMRVIGIGFDGRIGAGLHHGLAQPVALPARLGEARLVIGIGACPIAVHRLVRHVLEIADRIVGVAFGVISQGLEIALLRRADEGIVAIIAVRR